MLIMPHLVAFSQNLSQKQQLRNLELITDSSAPFAAMGHTSAGSHACVMLGGGGATV